MSMVNTTTGYVERLARPSLGSRVQLLTLAGVTVLAAVLRFYRLGDWSFWIDEIFTIGRLQAHVDLQHLSGYQEPLSILFTSVMFQLFGVSEWSARLFSAIIGVISIPVLFLSIRKLFDSKVALVAALLLAVAPWHLFWSQNARYYATLMLLYAIAGFAFYLGLELDKPWQFAIFYAAFFFALRERFVSLFLLPVVGAYFISLWVLPWPKPPGFRPRNFALLFGPLFLVVASVIYGYITTGESMLTHTFQFFFGIPNISPLRLLTAIVYRLGVPLVVLGGLAGLYMLRRQSRAALFTLIAAVLPVLLLVGLSPFAFTVDRYVFATLPFWTVLGALFVVVLSEQLTGDTRFLTAGVLMLLVVTSLGELLLYYEFQNGNRPDWRGSFSLVSECRQEGDLVVATRPEVGEYYLSEEIGNVNRLELDELEESQQRVWIVIDEATGPLDPIIGMWIVQNALLVDVNAVYLPGKSLSIRTYLYDPERTGVCSLPLL